MLIEFSFVLGDGGQSFMPIIHVELVEGRTKEQKKQLGQEITKATVEIMKVPTDAVKVIFVDMKKDDFMEGGVLRSEK